MVELTLELPEICVVLQREELFNPLMLMVCSIQGWKDRAPAASARRGGRVGASDLAAAPDRGAAKFADT